MNKYGQFNFIAVGISAVGVVVSIAAANMWLCLLNLFFFFLNMWIGHSIVKSIDKK